MILVYCLDDNYGMMFNSRRQSMDSMVRENISSCFEKIIMSKYTYSQFEVKDNIVIAKSVDEAFKLSDDIEESIDHANIVGRDIKIEESITGDILNMRIDYSKYKVCFFVEDMVVDDFSDVERIIVYYWNRKYPADVYFDKNILDDYYESSVELIEGSSHDKIKRIDYIKKGF